MSRSEELASTVTKFPLVKRDMPAIPALIAIVRRLSIARSLPEVMEIITHAARTLIGADGITFVLREGDLCYYAEEDAISALWKGRCFPMTACISGWCMLARKSAIIPDIYKDVRIPQDAYRPTFVRSLIMVPVRQDDPMAAIGAYWADTREISDAEVELLQGIANAAALAIAHIEVRANTTVHHSSGPDCPDKYLNATGLGGLSKRQLQVLTLLVQGKTNVEIAKALSCSPNTIKIHVSAILDQLNVKSRTQAAFLFSKLLHQQNQSDCAASPMLRERGQSFRPARTSPGGRGSPRAKSLS